MTPHNPTREIKFRAFVDCEEHGKRWVYPHKMEIFDTVIYIYDPNYDHEYQLEPNQLNQFTGVLDKNGKEIYEGDIVRGFEGEVANPEVFVSEVRWSSEGYRSCWWIESRNISLSEGVIKDLVIEIIGNIYENPELMEDLLGKER